MKKKRKKRPMTLVEVMIVIAIISLIAGVVGVKMRDGLEKGKAFKTEMAINKLYEILIFEDIKDPSNLTAADRNKINQSEFTRNADSVLRDGWGEEFTFVPKQNEEIEFYSRRYVEYCQRKGRTEKYPWDDDGNPVRNYPNWNATPIH
ncbi:MAG: type II secretion system protein [Chlamydiota bacterium]